MKFIQMMDQPVEPGGLVEWVPSSAGGFAEWITDPRPTSHNHEMHLRSALEYRWRTRREGGRESWLGLAIEFDEPMSVPAIRSALTGWIDRHEVLRSHVIVKHSGLQRLSTPPGTVHLKMARIGWYSEAAPLLDQLAGAFDRATAPIQWPAYLFATVARERSFTLLFAGDHSLLDGYSLILGQYELVELYRAARARIDPALPPTGSYVDFSAQERLRADAADTDHPAVQSWREFLSNNDYRLPTFSLSDDSPTVPTPMTPMPSVPAQTDPDGPAQSSVNMALLDDADADRFTVTCTEAGGNLFAGVLAALALTYHELGGGEFCCLTTRHTRREAVWLGALGWFVGNAPVTIAVSDNDSFPDLVLRATGEMRRTKVAADLPVLRVAEVLGAYSDPKFVVSFIDARTTPNAADADAGGARVLRSHSYSDDEVFIWVNRVSSGLRLSARFPAQGGLHTQVADFLPAFAQTLRRILDQRPPQPINRSVG
ncbi:condensation domain-containing protein [Williamsia sp. CHRR-6]|uniref:condensation domain-containing protein n=1 Tax=Williamsia sp. CHRR-6 TaxID=2835871 RepID=UPI001BDA3A4F|nr:condensation domain-containing protein [Williamsia sp. CHRR-6]MBT0566861.1 condensation protein [Williamsia sp. CHRR-6]